MDPPCVRVPVLSIGNELCTILLYEGDQVCTVKQLVQRATSDSIPVREQQLLIGDRVLRDEEFLDHVPPSITVVRVDPLCDLKEQAEAVEAERAAFEAMHKELHDPAEHALNVLESQSSQLRRHHDAEINTLRQRYQGERRDLEAQIDHLRNMLATLTANHGAELNTLRQRHQGERRDLEAQIEHTRNLLATLKTNLTNFQQECYRRRGEVQTQMLLRRAALDQREAQQRQTARPPERVRQVLRHAFLGFLRGACFGWCFTQCGVRVGRAISLYEKLGYPNVFADNMCRGAGALMILLGLLTDQALQVAVARLGLGIWVVLLDFTGRALLRVNGPSRRFLACVTLLGGAIEASRKAGQESEHLNVSSMMLFKAAIARFNKRR